MRAVLPRGVTDGGGYLDESPLSAGLLEPSDVAIADALAVARPGRLRTGARLVRPALDRRLRRSCCASWSAWPAARASACASTTP